jgi:hypothetical protein
VSRSDSVLAGALEDHNDEDEGCDMCGPSFTCDVKLVLDEVPGLLAALDELEAENKKLKLDLAAAEHYTTDDLTSPARLCVKCRCPWPCEFTSVPAQGYGRTGGGPAFQSWLDESFEKSHGRLLDDTFPA